MKAFFIVPQVTHYRLSFYKKLIATNNHLEWLVIDGQKKSDDGRPTLYENFEFPHRRFDESFNKVGPFTIRDYEGLYTFVVNENPDIIIFPTIVGTSAYRKLACWCKRNNKWLILWSCLWEHEKASKSVLNLAKRIVLKRFLRYANYHIAYSTYAKNKLIGLGVDKTKISIAYNGLDIQNLEAHNLDLQQKRSIQSRLGIDNCKSLLYVGGLGEDKNVSLLINAFSNFVNNNPSSNIKVLIIGDGPEKSKLEKLATHLKLSDRILFLGRIVKDVDTYFQIADCYILPGAGGLGLNQAMYWEKPCIVSHADGTEEDLVFDGKTGFRFERNSVSSLENAIKSFYLTNKRELKLMGNHSKEIIVNRSNVNKMIEVFSDVLKACN